MKKKCTIAICAAGAMAMLATGCSQGKTAAWTADVNSIYVDKNMEIESSLVYTSDKSNDLYTKDGLETFAGEVVSAYNAAQGAGENYTNVQGQEKLPVALKECRLEGQTGTLVFDYATGEDFVKFSKEAGDDSHTVTALRAAAVTNMAGDLGNTTFTTLDGQTAELSAVTGLKDGVLVEVTGGATVYTEGKIAFVSEGVTVDGETCATTPEGTTSYIVSK